MEINATANALYEAYSDSDEKYFDFFEALYDKTHIQPNYSHQQHKVTGIRMSNIRRSDYKIMIQQWSKKRGKLRLLINALNDKGHQKFAEKYVHFNFNEVTNYVD